MLNIYQFISGQQPWLNSSRELERLEKNRDEATKNRSFVKFILLKYTGLNTGGR